MTLEDGHGVYEANPDWLALFHQFDRDGDGFIPMPELKERIELAGEAAGLSANERRELLEDADRNRDARVDFGEFCIMMSRAKHMRARSVIFRAAQMVTAKEQREEKFSYLQQYSCCPPPVFLLILTLAEIAIYIYYVVEMKSGVSVSGPVPTQSPLIYNPYRRREAWRFGSYALIHIGIYHILFNSLAQLVLGIPLELVHQWRVIIVYIMGIIAGSLAVSVTDPLVFLAGASGGVYALIAAHLANLVVNWAEMEFAICRLIFVVAMVSIDVAVALYNRYGNPEASGGNKVSYVAHIGGFVAGLLMGIVVLRNFKKKSWERVVWWIALVGLIALFALCVLWNIFYPQYTNEI